MKKLAFIVLAGLALASSEAPAAVRAVACDGCSVMQMAAKATSTLDKGTVYVFNAAGATVRKYVVYTEVVDTQPYTIWKHASPLATEPELQEAYADYIEGLQSLEDEPIVLPPDFPIRSVAGAFLDPAYSSTMIEDYLRQLSLFAQLELRVTTIVARFLQRGIPGLDFGNILKVVRTTFEFPDGSSQEYEIYFSMDAISGVSQLEVEAVGNARMADGTAAPTGPMGFNGFTHHDRDGSLREWFFWARQLGLIVTGSLDDGTLMECEIQGNVIKCVVTKSK